MTRQQEKDRAQQLGAKVAATLIKATLPSVYTILLPDKIDQVQRLLDVDVLIPDVTARYKEREMKSVTIGYGGQGNHHDWWPREKKQLQDELNAYLNVEKAGYVQVRIAYEKLLTSDAFKTTSDNPDEAAHLLAVARALAERGVWLYVKQNPLSVGLILGHDRSSYGYIPIGAGKLDRSVIRKIWVNGVDYDRAVRKGPTLTLLKNAIRSIDAQRSQGWHEHRWWWEHRREFPIVSRVSDLVGGADWPDPLMWIEPQTHLATAFRLIGEGKLTEAGKFVVLAAWQVDWRARVLDAYIDATRSGAQRAVDVLEIAAAAGEIAETVLTVIWLGEGMIRLLSKRGASEVISTVAKESYVSPPARATKYAEEKMYQKYIQGKAPAGKSPSTPTPGKSPTGSPISKSTSTTPPGQRPSGGSSSTSGQTGPGGSPPTPPNPTGPGATALPIEDNEWQQIVSELSDIVMEHGGAKRVKAVIHTRNQWVGVPRPVDLIPDIKQLDVVRARARHLMHSGKIDPRRRDAAETLLIELDNLEIAGRLPPPPPPPPPRPRRSPYPRPYAND
jgi:hypothetical protein